MVDVQADVGAKEFGAEQAVKEGGVSESCGRGIAGEMRLTGVRLRSGGSICSTSSVMCIREEMVWWRTASVSVRCRVGDAERSGLTVNMSAMARDGVRKERE